MNIKMTFTGYITGWNKENLKNLFKESGTEAVGIVLMPVWFGIAMIYGSSNTLSVDILITMAFLIPIVFVWISQALHPLKKNKMFYLLPRNHEERKSRIVDDYLFQIVVHMMAFIIGDIVIFAEGHFNITGFMALIFNGFVFSTILVTDDEGTKAFIAAKILFTICIFMSLAQMVIVSDRDLHVVMQIVLFVMALTIELPLYVYVMKNIIVGIEKAVEYKGA